jgi:hypothetical protein
VGCACTGRMSHNCSVISKAVKVREESGAI